MAAARPLQLTLALLKPDAVAHPLVLEAVHETILSNRFLIVRAKELRCGREEGRRFYREHAAAPCGLISWLMKTLSPSGDPLWDPPKYSEPGTACRTPSEELMALRTPGIPRMAQIHQHQPAEKLPSSSQSSTNSSGTSRTSHVCAVGRCITTQRNASTVSSGMRKQSWPELPGSMVC
ncbi:nucleoside diphosphate kinase 6 isoform X3 [Dromaius novaehollandiae]|uniref:nucleoside diphosphate kinase 6 isoform X3 n=1 Tax=Dromaius novaehollandiae TaxID=8790 RepID=UPI00312009D6